MPTPNQLIGRLRQMLDDEVGSARKAGSFYSDTEVVRQLDTSQDLVITTLYEANLIQRLQGLFTAQTTPLASGLQSQALPGNYYYPVRAEIGTKAARLYNGGESAVFETPNHYGALIEGNVIVWKGGSGNDGTLWYIRRPTTLSVNRAVPRTELDVEGYNLILYHAATMLGSKEQGSDDRSMPGWRISRYKRYMESALKALMAAPPSLYPAYTEEAL